MFEGSFWQWPLWNSGFWQASATLATIILVILTGWYTKETRRLAKDAVEKSRIEDEKRSRRGHGQVILLWHELVLIEKSLQGFLGDLSLAFTEISSLRTDVWESARFEIHDAVPLELFYQLSAVYNMIVQTDDLLNAVKRRNFTEDSTRHLEDLFEKRLTQVQKVMEQLKPYRDEAEKQHDD